jgi:hypothetical protein
MRIHPPPRRAPMCHGTDIAVFASDGRENSPEWRILLCNYCQFFFFDLRPCPRIV